MQLLMHVCCGPCTLYPLSDLRRQGIEPVGYFYNPNIHPYREFKRRIAALRQVAEEMDFPVEIERQYGLQDYLRQVVFNESRPQRCGICYRMRLERTAARAKSLGMEAITTTLLYSRYQYHDEIRRLGEEIAADHGLVFLYQDFRTGWQQGIDMALAMDLYRQPYCGCIYSEQERYDKKLRKKLSKIKKTEVANV